MPYVTRVLGSENYGKYSYCLSIVNYFMLISALGISAYATREITAIREDKCKTKAISSELFTINVVTTTISYILIIVLLFIWNPTNEYKYIILILSVEIICQTLNREWIYFIYEDYKFITIRTVIFQLIRLFAVFFIVKTKDDLLWFTIISVFCTVIICIINCFYTSKYIKFSITSKVNISQHLPPLLVIFLSSLVSSIYLNSDLTMLGIIKDDTDVGIYKVSTQIYGMVKTMLNAVVVVMIPRMAYYFKSNNIQEFRNLLARAFSSILIIVIPAMCGLIMVAKDIVYILAGDEYSRSIIPLQILSVALVFATIGNICVSGVLITIKKEKSALGIAVISASCNVVFNIFMIPLISSIGAAITTLLSEMLVMTLGAYLAKQYIPFKGIIKPLFISFIGGTIICILCSLLNQLSLNVFLGLIIKIVICAISYFGILVFIPDTRKLIRKIVKNN